MLCENEGVKDRQQLWVGELKQFSVRLNMNIKHFNPPGTRPALAVWPVVYSQFSMKTES